MTTTTTIRKPNPHYREHDGATAWQECDTCHLRLGAGVTTEWDSEYYDPDHDPDQCPRCTGGRMCLPASA